MTSPQTPPLPPVATLWIGPRLGWIDELMLNSFRAHGHAVTLFVSSDFNGKAPEGIEVRNFLEIWPEGEKFLGNTKLATIADVFRIHLMNHTDFIWADSDVIALKPFVPTEGYMVGYERNKVINNCVLRLPKDSEALGVLTALTTEGATVPPWMIDEVDETLNDAPYETIIKTASDLKPNTYGPHAVTWAMRLSGESEHALKPKFLSPLPWVFCDVPFNPGGGMTHWISDETIAVHLYASRIRVIHKRKRPRRGSFLFRVKRNVEHTLGISSNEG